MGTGCALGAALGSGAGDAPGTDATGDGDAVGAADATGAGNTVGPADATGFGLAGPAGAGEDAGTGAGLAGADGDAVADCARAALGAAAWWAGPAAGCGDAVSASAVPPPIRTTAAGIPNASAWTRVNLMATSGPARPMPAASSGTAGAPARLHARPISGY